MSGARIKGWCPDAWRPMHSGDGWLVRVRPPLGRLSRDQVFGLCRAASRFGAGTLQLTNRANLQIRGVREAYWPALMDALIGLGLVAAEAEQERRRNWLVAPDWRAGDPTHCIAKLLTERAAALPELPGKVGFAIDAGPAPVLAEAPADFRIETTRTGRLLLRADGRTRGTPLDSAEQAVDALIDLAHWFVQSGGARAGRMARHYPPLPAWAPPQASPAEPAGPLRLGRHPLGAVHGLAFGQIEAETLMAAMQAGGAHAVRVTPWRRLLFEGAAFAPRAGLLSDNDSPELNVQACVGAPACEQAGAPTRDLAQRLSPAVAGRLHVSGCSKGCADSRPADVCLVARDGRYDLVRQGRADDRPHRAGLSEAQVLAYFGVL